MRTDTPKGVKQLDIKDSFLIDQIERSIEKNLKLWGYEKLILPLLEYYHTHSLSLDSSLLKNSFRIVDRFEGETLLLRPDFTAQIARFVASQKDKDFPIRLYYCGDVFRYTIPKGENVYERRQIGAELIGVNEIEADAEIIGVAVSSLKRVGIEDFQIDINNVKLHYGIKSVLNLSEDEFSEFMGYIKNREIFNIKKFVLKMNVDKEIKEFIISLPKLKGDIELLVDLANRVKGIEPLENPIKELIGIYGILKEYELSDYVFFDLGEPREFEYYTGIVFEIFSKSHNRVLGFGGRYNNLLSKYDGNYPGAGFALDIFHILDIVKESYIPDNKDYYIIDTTDDKKTAHQIASMLRSKGFSVARDIIKRNPERSKDIAFKKGFKNVIFITIENSEKKVYIFSKDGSKKDVKDILG